eukprot:NODE_3_length_56144_cov_0.348184.p7 type:complete len:1141 gc:universal NODE_3_length_56144_cov_0.348184:48904-45482(-)
MLDDFPTLGLLPKQTTQALEFIQKTGFDGKNTLIAILDTGIDPSAPGLQTTSDGKVKVVDCIDCTCSGDVKLTEWITVTSDLKTLSGKPIKLPSNITKIKMGIKHALDLYPKDLWNRLKSKRLESIQPDHLSYLVQANQLLSSITDKINKSTQPDPNDVLLKQDYQSRVDILNDLLKSTDQGILFDIIVYCENNQYFAIVDKIGDGDFTAGKPMSQYSISQQFDHFSDGDQLTYSFNFYTNSSVIGKNDSDLVLSIVCVAGSHGTHVGSITSAYFPNNAACNGVSPGSQLISLKIGDTRLGSMETNTGLLRALKYISDYKCDLANLSYGESCKFPDSGLFPKLLTKLINNGCIFISSAGNAGPCLSTVGAPGGTTSTVISVGAHVDNDQVLSEYSLSSPCTTGPYTWSSRGPTMDGHYGVDVYCPGSAITSIPKYNLFPNQLMNGTSMSSPNCCGCLSLLVGWYKNTYKVSPHSYLIQNALRSSAVTVKDVHDIPFMQVLDMYNWLIKSMATYNTNPFDDITINPFNIHYAINTDAALDYSGRGIYIRDANEYKNNKQINVTINCKFPFDDLEQLSSLKLLLDLNLVLSCTLPCVNHPKYLKLSNMGRSFKITINPDLLTTLNTGDLNCYLDNKLLIKIPITIIKPLLLTKDVLQLHSTENTNGITRHFINPGKYNSCLLNITPSNSNSTYYIHVQQLVMNTRHEENEQLIRVADKTTKRIEILPNTTMEICIAQFWNNSEKSELSINMEFQLNKIEEIVVLNSKYNVIKFRANTTSSKLTVKSELTHEISQLLPVECNPVELGNRDYISSVKHKLQALQCKYTTAIEKESTIKLSSTFDDLLYDAKIGMAIMVYKDYQLIHVQDVFSKSFKCQGSITILIEYKHENIDVLNKLNKLILMHVQVEKIDLKPTLISGGLYEIDCSAIDALKKSGTYLGAITVNSSKKDIIIDYKHPATPATKEKGIMTVVNSMASSKELNTKVFNEMLSLLESKDQLVLKCKMVINDQLDKLDIDFGKLLASVNGAENEYSENKEILKDAYCVLLFKQFTFEKYKEYLLLHKAETKTPTKLDDCLKVIAEYKNKKCYGIGIKHCLEYLKSKNDAKIYDAYIELVKLLGWKEWEIRIKTNKLLGCGQEYLLF